MPQDGIGFTEQLQRLLDTAFLEQQPAFGNPHGGRHRFETGFGGITIAFRGMVHRFVVFASFARTTGTPEVSERDDAGIGDFPGEGKHESEIRKRAFDIFFRHPDHSFGHQDVGVIEQRERDAAAFGECSQSFLNDIDVAPTCVHPLRYVKKQAGGVRAPRIEAARSGPVLIEPGHAAADPAHAEIAAKSVE